MAAMAAAKVVTVSILARPFGRALRYAVTATVSSVPFQSSPALSDGRYDRAAITVNHIGSFNPRPPFRTGATAAPRDLVAVRLVSILARPFGRALPLFVQFNQ